MKLGFLLYLLWIAPLSAQPDAFSLGARIGYLDSTGTVLLPIEATDEDGALYTGKGHSLRAKIKRWEAYSPAALDTLELPTIKYPRDPPLTLFYGEKSTAATLSGFASLQVGCGETLPAHRIVSPWPDSDRHAPVPVLAVFDTNLALQPLAPLSAADPPATLLAQITQANSPANGRQEDLWLHSGPVWINYQGFFNEQDLLTQARRTILRQMDGQFQSISTTTRSTDMPLLQSANIKSWYREFLGHVQAVYQLEGHLLFLSQYWGYESRATYIEEAQAGKTVRLLYDGRYRGC
ncbi:MAG: hypothetical protein GKR89_16115 [Candidatus Latescibacteria bacterium]|nr:hypothetical protein [Candidatus Latescibacterota bacterium]